MTIPRLILVGMAILFLVGAVTATTITVPSCSVNAQKKIPITTDSCTNGLSTYTLVFSTGNGTISKITEVQPPSWATGWTCGAVPAQTVTCTATDGGNVIQAGDSCTLGTVCVNSLVAGSTTVNVGVTTFNDDASNPIGPTVSNGTLTSLTSARVMAAATFTPVSTQAYHDIYEAIGGNATPQNETQATINWTELGFATVSPYTLLIGQLAFVIIFAIPFVLMWLMQQDMTPAAVAGIIIGGFMLAFLPAEYSLLAGILTVLAILAVIYSLLKERM